MEETSEAQKKHGNSRAERKWEFEPANLEVRGKYAKVLVIYNIYVD